jgi:hypothetical protein
MTLATHPINGPGAWPSGFGGVARRRALNCHRIGHRPCWRSCCDAVPLGNAIRDKSARSGELLCRFRAARCPIGLRVLGSSMASFWRGSHWKHVKLTRRAAVWTTIVGIVANARTESLENTNVPQIYTSLYQRGANTSRSSCADTWIPLQFLKQCASRFSPSIRPFQFSARKCSPKPCRHRSTNGVFVRNRRFVCSDGVAFGGYRNVRNAFLPGQRNERAKSGSGSRSARSDGRFCKCCYNMGSDSPSPVLPLALSLRCFFQI